MPENMIALVNIFILPLISLYVYNKRYKKEFVFSLETLCVYAVFLAVATIFNKGITVLIKMQFLKDISVASSYYTLFGIVTAVLVPIVFEMVKKHFSLKIEVKNDKK